MLPRPHTIFKLFFLCVCSFLPAAESTVHAADTGQSYYSETRPLLHTIVEIKAYGKDPKAAVAAAFDEMARINALLNNYSPDSEISHINKNAGAAAVQISEETMGALQAAVAMACTTGGAFDFTITPLLGLWGFGRDNPSLQGNDAPEPSAIAAKCRLVDFKALMLNTTWNGTVPSHTARLAKPGMSIDVGGFSKGYVADKGLAVLRRHGIHNGLIAAGGTICAMGIKPGAEPWRIGVQHPRKDDDYITAVELHDRCISTSGDYQNFYKRNGRRVTHIIDPRTGFPVDSVQSATVVADNGITSDALSTALFVLGPDEGIARINTMPGVEALLITGSGHIRFSSNWPVKIVAY